MVQEVEVFMKNNSSHEGSASGESSLLIRRLWKEILKTAVFLLATIIVIIIGSIAWFVSNDRTQAATASVSAQHDLLRLATKGRRQSSEETFLDLNPGETLPVEPGQDPYYFTEGGTIALRLDSDKVSVRPGFRGEVTFYIIPKRTGALEATLHLELAGYQTHTENAVTTAKPVEDDVLDALLCGHILLFRDENYSDWLWTGNGNILRVSESAREGEPIPVTFYWYWPLRYRDMEEDWLDRTLTKPLPSDLNYLYNRVFIAKDGVLTDDKICDEAYNRADEYIGSHADFLYLSIQTSLEDEPTP